MLEQILDYVHNYFIKEVHSGIFEVTDGALDVDFLQEGQYFMVVGSVFNDGVHQYPSADLTDEVFNGEVRAMAVPPAVIALAADIEDWMEKYGDTVNSPYTSESFGGYSYSKANGGQAQGGAGTTLSWQNIFARRLNHWRKIS